MLRRRLQANIAVMLAVAALAACSAGPPPSVSEAPASPTPAAPATPTTPPPTAIPATATTSQATPETAAPATAVPTVPAADAKAVYDELATRYREETSMCVATPVPTPEPCPRPASNAGSPQLKPQILIEIILDVSGSMAAPIEGRPKYEIAKAALSQFVATLPDHAQVALRVYGHVGSNQEQDKPASCAGSDLVVPFGPVDRAAMQRALDAQRPTGWTRSPRRSRVRPMTSHPRTQPRLRALYT